MKPITKDVLEKHARMVQNLRDMRRTVHQLITHPEMDSVADSTTLHVLASYGEVVRSTIDVTQKILKGLEQDHSLLASTRKHNLNNTLRALRSGDF